MSEESKYTRTYSNIQMKRGTSDRWVAKNPILLAGEIGLEIIDNGAAPDTFKIKIGDGLNTWTQLPYFTDTISSDEIAAATIEATNLTTSTATASTQLTVGSTAAQNLFIDNNEIQARAAGVASPLYLQSVGGTTYFGENNPSNNSNVSINGALSVLSGTTLNASVTSSGYVTSPRQPRFFVTNEGGGGTSATNKIAFNQVPINVGSHWSAANNRFTAPITGHYFFSHSVLSSTSAVMNVTYYKNGSAIAIGQFPRGYSTSIQYISNTASGFIYLNQNDYIELWCTNGVSHTNHVNFTGFFAG